jgi:hypothetical protein
MHCKGHIRDTFLRAIDAFYCWDDGEPEPTVEHEIHYQPVEISLTEACKLVWRCTDILPGTSFRMIEESVLGEDVRSRTYAAVAHAMLAYLKVHREFRDRLLLINTPLPSPDRWLHLVKG